MKDIEKMLEEGIKTLSENDSKQLLSEYGVPVTREKVVATEEDAVAAATEIGYPVVLKGSGEALAHKTELNLIALDLRDEKDVRKACKRILSTPGGNIKEVLVQQMVKGDREVVVGLTRDPQFGPCVMFGIGGIFTEIMEDVSFRVAPLSRSDAMDMMDQIRGSKILDGIRGKFSIDREALADILVAVGEIGMKHEMVSEIDINPLKFIHGKPVAVDALVVLDRIENKDTGAIAPVKDFGKNFPPESIGIVGVSRTGKTDVPGYTGLQIFRMLKESGFKGRVYPINPKADEIDGEKCYPDVSSVPERLDLVIITVTARIVPMVIEDCAKARPRCIQISTSGFSETGLPEDIDLENRIRETTLKNKLRVIGPNCIGFHVPSSRIAMHETITDLNSGPVALISQSGGLALNVLFLGPEFGINFSKVISYGNAMTIDADSFMEYLAKDPETQIICMYLEGVKNSRRLLEQVRETCAGKPVIILKSGLSESGARAASSHTGSMAGDKKMWDAFFRQTGAVQVQTIEEMAETVLCFLKLEKPLTRLQSAVLGIGGGTTVNNGDTCTREGIDVPKLSDQSICELSKFIDLTNQGISNPMDIPGVIFNFDALTKTLDVLNKDPKIDCVILTLLARMFSGPMEPMLPHFTTFLNKYAQEHPDSKPLVVSFSEEVYLSWLEKCVGEFRKAGILAFPSLVSACGALRRFAGYHQSVK